MPTGIDVPGWRKKLRALRCWSLWYSKALPWMELVPDFVTTVIEEEPPVPLVGIGRAGGDVYDVYSFSGNDITGILRQPDVDALGTVDLGDVGLTVAPVNVSVQGNTGDICL